MTLRLVALSLLLVCSPLGEARGASLEELLPAAGSYDPAVPGPASVLGFEVGEWHARPDQIRRYLEVLEASSPRLRLEVQGFSHERQPLPLLVVTAPANHGRLDELRQTHLARLASDSPEASRDELGHLPVVVWLGYSVHGDEASGANASLLVAYHLAAAQGPGVDELLARTVILLDPTLNPDGLGRFAQWANSHRGAVAVAEPAHREHQQGWPSGRTNHYWFDLNRDWFPLVHPESRARMATNRRWRPHLLGDFHEMGSDNTFFFQPGVPQRTHPLAPPEVAELTRRFARFPAEALDRLGSLYFTEEVFDDFYPGKGSTYPDLTGGVGILFEQASSRGIVQDTAGGQISFVTAIRHQLTASLAMLEAARALGPDLVAHSARFARQAREEAREDPAGGWVVSFPRDPVRAHHFLDLLLRHEIRVHRLDRPLALAGRDFDPASAFVVPADQDGYRLAKAIFERRTRFADTTFYDVSAWTLPDAFAARWAEIPRRELGADLLGEVIGEAAPPAGRFDVGPAYAWVIDGAGSRLPRALNRLLAAGLVPRLATRGFDAATKRGLVGFSAGSILVPGKSETVSTEATAELLETIARTDGLDVYAVDSGLTPGGVDLGSPQLKPLKAVKPLLVVGDGVSAYEAGEVWHLLDQVWSVPLVLLEGKRLATTDLGSFTHVILVDGDHDELGDKAVESLRRWVDAGGVLIATRGGAAWVEKRLPTDTTPKPAAQAAQAATPAPPAEIAATPGPKSETKADPVVVPRAAYGDFERARQAARVSGAIFDAVLDRTHPIAFGFGDDHLPVFRSGHQPLAASPNPYENVAVYSAEPLLAGYVSADNLAKLQGTAAVVATRQGRGAIIRFADDPTFRGYWQGTQRLLANAIFFGPTLQEMPPREKWE